MAKLHYNEREISQDQRDPSLLQTKAGKKRKKQNQSEIYFQHHTLTGNIK